jgi:hypothetical protein
MELTPQQIRTIERLQQRAFEIVAFPMYANYIGVRKGNCAALLAQASAAGFTVFGAPSYLIAGNLTAKVAHESGQWFVWKKDRLEATPDREAELAAFTRDLSDALHPTV